MNTLNTREKFSIKTTKDVQASQAKIEGIVPKEEIEKVKDTVLEQLGKEKKVDGFREGKVPKDVVEREVGSLEVWRRGALEVISKNFAEIITEEKVVPLGQPQMQITSVADKSDVSFQVEFYTMPEVQLPEYKQLLQEIEKPKEPGEATEEEVQQVVTDVRKGLYKKAHPEKDFPADDAELPELTDEYIREISQQHKDMESFLKGVRESVTREKAMQARAQFRQKILDTVLENTTINIPKIMIEEDSKRGYEELKAQAEHFGTTIEEYLKSQKMTEEKLWEQIRKDSERKAKTQIILNTISTQENIRANIDEVQREVERFKKRDATMDEGQMRTYIETLLTNEAVMQSLEKIVAGPEQRSA